MSKQRPISFKRIQPDDRFGGTGRVASIEMVPKLLVERFGKPSPGGAQKVSGMFVFEGDDGSVFTIYDWKLTGEYNPRLSPDEFWHIDDAGFPMQIGTGSGNRAKVASFVSWLATALVQGLTSDQEWLRDVER